MYVTLWTICIFGLRKTKRSFHSPQHVDFCTNHIDFLFDRCNFTTVCIQKSITVIVLVLLFPTYISCHLPRVVKNFTDVNFTHVKLWPDLSCIEIKVTVTLTLNSIRGPFRPESNFAYTQHWYLADVTLKTLCILQPRLSEWHKPIKILNRKSRVTLYRS